MNSLECERYQTKLGMFRTFDTHCMFTLVNNIQLQNILHVTLSALVSAKK